MKMTKTTETKTELQVTERVISKTSKLAAPYGAWVSEHQESLVVSGFTSEEIDVLARVIGVKAYLYTVLDASVNEVFPYEDIKVYAVRSSRLLKLALAQVKAYGDKVSNDAKVEINAHIGICKGILEELLASE